MKWKVVGSSLFLRAFQKMISRDLFHSRGNTNTRINPMGIRGPSAQTTNLAAALDVGMRYSAPFYYGTWNSRTVPLL